MKTLPNGITVFNATPHSITFWDGEWATPIVVPSDAVVSAAVSEKPCNAAGWVTRGIEFVTPAFKRTAAGQVTVKAAYQAGADLIIGSIIAAQAYPGQVVAMVPAPGYERVPPAEKRMRPDKFTMYEGGQ